MITEKQTWAYDIRDAFYNVVTADSFFAGFTLRKNRMLPVQQNLIPYLGVYLIDENQSPDGDGNAGCIRFLHTVRIGFSVVVASSDPVIVEQLADQGVQRIWTAAFTDLHLFKVGRSNIYNPEGVIIEAAVRGRRTMNFGAPTTDNEMPFCEAQVDVSCTFRTEWYPDITDMLDTIDVVTPDENGTITPVHVQYDLTASERQQVAYGLTSVGRRQPRAPPRRPWLSARDQHRRQ